MHKQKIVNKKNEKGQGFLELAISAVFLLILLSAVVDLGFAFFSLIALRDTTQEAASVGAICPTELAKVKTRLMQSASAPLDLSKMEDSQIKMRVYRLSGAGVETNICTYDGATAATPGACSGVKIDDRFEVTVTYEHNIITPFVGSFIGKQSYPLTSTTVDTVLSDTCNLK